MASVTVEISDHLQTKLKGGRTDAAAVLCLAAAYSLCQQGQLSTSQGASLAGMTYAEFLASAAAAKVDLFSIPLDELAEEIDRGFTLGGQRIADHIS